MKRKFWSFLVPVLLGVSLYLLVWGFWPPHRETVSLPLLPAEGIPYLPEKRMIQLSFSPMMRVGEMQTVELDLTTEGEGEDSSLYQEYSVIVEARLELPLGDVRPMDLVSTALTEGGEVTFYWEIYPRQVGDIQGTVWLYLRLIPRAGGKEIRQPVSAQLIKIHSRSLLGWSGSKARVAGVGGLFLGLVLGILILLARRIN